MIKLFEYHFDAKEFAMTHSRETTDGTMGVALGGSALWVNQDQILLFPVLIMKRCPPLAVFDLLSSGMGMPDESLREIRSHLSLFLDWATDLRIITISEWVIELQVPIRDESRFDCILKAVGDLNGELVAEAKEIYGSMPVVDPQPSPFYRTNRMIKIGLQ
jgi:hypothetical protein